jgi:hypothetical protein
MPFGTPYRLRRDLDGAASGAGRPEALCDVHDKPA